MHLPQLPVRVEGSGDAGGWGDIPLNLEEAEAILTQRALAVTKGNIAQAARLLGVNRARIYRRHRAGGGMDAAGAALSDENDLSTEAGMSM